MKSLRLSDLKVEGHDLIDELVADGVSRAKVYERLAKRLHVMEPHAHFRTMHTIEDAERAVKVLKNWVQSRKVTPPTPYPPNPPRNPAKRHKGIILPHDLQQKAFEELRRHREQQAAAGHAWHKVPFWKKLWIKITTAR